MFDYNSDMTQDQLLESINKALPVHLQLECLPENNNNLSLVSNGKTIGFYIDILKSSLDRTEDNSLLIVKSYDAILSFAAAKL